MDYEDPASVEFIKHFDESLADAEGADGAMEEAKAKITKFVVISAVGAIAFFITVTVGIFFGIRHENNMSICHRKQSN